MSDREREHSIDFLGKSFTADEVIVEPDLSAARTLLVKASPRMVLRWTDLDASFFEANGRRYDLASQEGSPSTASIELDGYEYPILSATVRSVRFDKFILVELEGLVESVEYEGCDEVARAVPFRAAFAVREA